MAHEARSIFEICADDGWAPVLFDLRNNQIPSASKLVEGLRGTQEVPPLVRAHIADLLEGKVKMPKGRPPNLRAGGIRALIRDLDIRMIFDEVRRDIQTRPSHSYHGTPTEEALVEAVARLSARGIHISSSGLRAHMYRKPKKLPRAKR